MAGGPLASRLQAVEAALDFEQSKNTKIAFMMICDDGGDRARSTFSTKLLQGVPRCDFFVAFEWSYVYFEHIRTMHQNE
jgi:hypothetical protein